MVVSAVVRLPDELWDSRSRQASILPLRKQCLRVLCQEEATEDAAEAEGDELGDDTVPNELPAA